MKRHEIFLLLSFLSSQVNIKVVANDISSKSGLFGYHTFFCYGDRNHDGKLSMDEWDHSNKAWSSEFQELYNRISASLPLKDEIEKKGHITRDEFKKMSIPGRNYAGSMEKKYEGFKCCLEPSPWWPCDYKGDI